MGDRHKNKNHAHPRGRVWELGALLMLLLAACDAASLYDGKEAVTQFTTVADFDKAVLADATTAWVVQVYTAENCPACEQIADPYAAAAAECVVLVSPSDKLIEASIGVRFAAVEATAKTDGAKIARRMNVQMGPAILLLAGESTTNPYTGKPHRETVAYTNVVQSDGLSGLKRWVGSNLPSLDRAASKADLPVAPYVVFATERATTAPLAKAYGVAVRGLGLPMMEIQQPKYSTNPLLENSGVHELPLPKILAVNDTLATARVFDGDMADKAAVLAWLRAFAAEAKAKAATTTGDDNASSGDASPNEAVVVTAITSAAQFGDEVLKADVATILVPPGQDLPGAVAKKVLEAPGVLNAAALGEGLCTGEARPSACEKLLAGRFVAYHHGAGTRRSSDHADAQGALEAASNSVSSNHVELVGAGVNFDALMAGALRPPAVVEGSASSSPSKVAVLVFSKQDDVSFAVRSASHLLRHVGLTVIQYVVTGDPADLDLMQRFGLRKAPAVVAIHEAPAPPETVEGAFGIGVVPFDRIMFGPPTGAALTVWMVTILQQVSPEHAATLQKLLGAAEETNSPKKKTKMNSPGTAGEETAQKRKASSLYEAGNLAEVSSAAMWDEICGPSSAYALCAVAFLDAHGRSATFADEVAVARQVAAAEGANNAVFAFGWVDGACHRELAGAFDVSETSIPTLVAFAPKKQRFATFVGSYTEAELKSFVRGVVSGRVGTRPTLQAPPPIDGARDCAAQYAATFEAPAAADEDDFDFMAEIIAEEAAAKAQLEEEAAAASAALKAQAAADKKKAAEAAANADGAAKPKKRRKRKPKADL